MPDWRGFHRSVIGIIRTLPGIVVSLESLRRLPVGATFSKICSFVASFASMNPWSSDTLNTLLTEDNAE